MKESHVVLIPGILGWGEDTPLWGFAPWYWDIDMIREHWGESSRVHQVQPGVVASAHDRACDTFYQLLGGPCVRYGDAHSAANGHEPACPNPHPKGLHPSWSPRRPVHLIGHSWGCCTALKLCQLLSEGFFGPQYGLDMVTSVTCIVTSR